MYSFLAYVLIPTVSFLAFAVVLIYSCGTLFASEVHWKERHRFAVGVAKEAFLWVGSLLLAFVVLVGIGWGSIALFNVARTEAAMDKPTAAAIRLSQIEGNGTGNAKSEPRWKREYEKDAAMKAGSLHGIVWWADNASGVKKLLDKGANPNERNSDGETLLIKIAGYGFAANTVERIAGSEYLLKAGADINAGDNDGCTAVCMATNFGDYYHLLYLLDAGADPRIATTKNGWTPLAIAKNNKDPRKVKALEEALAKYPK